MSEDDFPTGKVEELKALRTKELQAISKFHENMEQTLYEILTMVKDLFVRDQRNIPGKISIYKFWSRMSDHFLT